MCDHVLPPPNIILHCQESHLLPCRRCRGVSPPPVPCPPRDTSHHPYHHLVLNPPQGLDHAGGDHPGLCSEEKYRLDHSLKKEAGHPRCCYLPDEDMQHPTPNLPCPGHFLHHLRPIIVCRIYQPPQVFEGGHHIQGAPIGAESFRG